MSVIYGVSLSTFNFTTSDYQLIVSQSGQIIPTSGDAIDTSYGQAYVLISGFVAGEYEGFFDTNASYSGDIISVSATGSLIGQSGSAITAYHGDVTINNNGNIGSPAGTGIEVGASNRILNAGNISGFYYAVADGGSDSIANSGEMSSTFYQDTTIYEGAGSNSINNSGSIMSTGAAHAVYLAGGSNTLSNSGTIEGSANGISISGGLNSFYNSGTLSSSNDDVIISGSGGGTTINNTGLIQAIGLDGVAVAYSDTGAGDLLDNSGRILGNVTASSSRDVVTNSGVIDGNITFTGGGASLRNTGDITGTIRFAGDNNFYRGHPGSVEGAVILSGAHGTYNGGAGGTTFYVAATELASTLTINGGASQDDTIDFYGAGTIAKLAFKLVAGIETIGLGASETIAIPQHLAITGSGGQLTINATGKDTVDLSALGASSPSAVVWGGGGSDTIIAGADAEVFGFATVASSTGPTFDFIKGANLSQDVFDVSGAAGVIGSIDTAVTSGYLDGDASVFNAELAAALPASKLAAGSAVLFSPNAGTDMGKTFLVIDANDTAGYQAGQDLVIRLGKITGTLTTANFV